jgi:hypothetical protein
MDTLPEMGSLATHRFSGFQGTVTAHSTYITGELYVRLEGVDTTGRPVETWENVKDVNQA